jgi:hypothetical protein
MRTDVCTSLRDDNRLFLSPIYQPHLLYTRRVSPFLPSHIPFREHRGALLPLQPTCPSACAAFYTATAQYSCACTTYIYIYILALATCVVLTLNRRRRYCVFFFFYVSFRPPRRLCAFVVIWQTNFVNLTSLSYNLLYSIIYSCV